MTTLEVTEAKILSRDILKNRVAMWRFQNQKIVFTNGCFDLLHKGHIEYLSKARDLGDILIIGLNTDDSVRRLKGNGRPLQDEKTRAMILASIRFVEVVCLFNEDTPYELINVVWPDVLVKGGDYNEDQVVGADLVKASGGVVVTIPLTPGHSTSGLIEKLK
jgi:D-glycero-beta-D-manno-heptose 1-phosphate adenylyltransferase